MKTQYSEMDFQVTVTDFHKLGQNDFRNQERYQ